MSWQHPRLSGCLYPAQWTATSGSEAYFTMPSRWSYSQSYKRIWECESTYEFHLRCMRL